MFNIMDLTGDKIEVNSLFIQPTNWCTKNCKNCYVKEHCHSPYQIPMEQFVKLISEAFIGELIKAKQITVSMDNIYTVRPNIAKELFARILYAKKHLKTDNSPEIHLTFHNRQTIEDYLGLITTSYWLNYIDLITLSNIKPGDVYSLKAQKFVKHINVNHMPPTNITSINLDEHLRNMEELLVEIDSMYITIFKPPMGKKLTPKELEFYVERMKSDIIYINTLCKHLPSELVIKIHIDDCLTCMQRHRISEYGCSGNVSRFQVWPDGSVSGCPYAYHSNTRPANNYLGIIKNIKEARKFYDFENCTLRVVYDTIIERSIIG